MCFEYAIGLVLLSIAIICLCGWMANTLKTDIKLIKAEAKAEKLQEENKALKEVIRKQQIIINANEQ